MSNLADYLRLIRLHNLPLVLASVLVGGWLESGRILSSDILISALSAALIAAFGYAHNDYWVWKKSFLLGDGVVSILTAGPFIYGGVAVKKVSLCLVPALFSFLFHFG